MTWSIWTRGGEMISVICWLWGDPEFRFRDAFRYTPEHVVRLKAMVDRHLTMEHDFICITDRPQSVFPTSVRVMPIWDDLADLGGCYRRLPIFGKVAGGMIGNRFVSIDLDCVITGQLDPLFDRPEDFVIWEDVDPRQPYCGSMFMMDPGARHGVWDAFDIEVAKEGKRQRGWIGTDQAWMADYLRNEATWTKADGVYSIADRHFRGHKLGNSLEAMARRGYTTTLPTDARIVFFHGKRDPSMKIVQQVHPWIEEYYGPPFETKGTKT